MRSLSADAIKAMLGQTTDLMFFALLTVRPPEGQSGETLRFVNNNENIIHNGEEYLAFPFEISLPADTEEAPPVVRVKVDNVDRSMVSMLRTFIEPLRVKLEVISYSSATSNTEIGPMDFLLLSYNNLQTGSIEFSLGYESDILNEAATRDSFSPSIAPALF